MNKTRTLPTVSRVSIHCRPCNNFPDI